MITAILYVHGVALHQVSVQCFFPLSESIVVVAFSGQFVISFLFLGDWEREHEVWVVTRQRG